MGFSEILAFVLAATFLVTSPGPNGALIAKTVPSSGQEGATGAVFIGFGLKLAAYRPSL